MASATYYSGEALLVGLTTGQALEMLAEMYLDAREWRAEESDLLEQYSRELKQTRAMVHYLARELGEQLPAPERLRNLQPTPGAYVYRERHRKGVRA